MTAPAETEQVAIRRTDVTVYGILMTISFAHLLNDTIQSLLPALYPILRESFSLSYAQVGLIALAFQVTAAVLQPVVGLAADRRPMPYSLMTGMTFTFCGVLLLAYATSYLLLLAAAALIGLGSAIFHPESARVARMAAGGKAGLAQSVFQVGGNLGHALGPLLAAFIIVAIGRDGTAWFALIPLCGMIVLFRVGAWYAAHVKLLAGRKRAGGTGDAALSQRRVVGAVIVLLALIISKQLYMASLTSYYTFYLIDVFGLPVATAQVYLFFYLFAIAVGTLIGGSLSDRFGRKAVIWFSILGALPFALALPYADLFWTAILTVLIGMIMSSSLAVIIVFAQDLIPGRIGLISGLFLGFAFGMSGIGALIVGALADAKGLEFVYTVCSFIPAAGIIAAFLPSMGGGARKAA